MITYKELKDNGFIPDGEWNNRDYFTKTGFNIVCHNGYIYKWNRKNPSGYGNNFETIEELNAAYIAWRDKQIKKLTKLLNILENDFYELY